MNITMLLGPLPAHKDEVKYAANTHIEVTRCFVIGSK